MGAFSFLRYSFGSVLRNKKRSVFAAIGIALAMGLVSGSFIAVDSSAYGLLRSAINQVEVDFVADGALYTEYNNPDSFIGMEHLNSLIEDIEGVKDVEKATPLVTYNNWGIKNYTGSNLVYGGGPYMNWGSYLAFLPSDSRKLLDAYHIHGDVPANGTAAVPKLVADSMDLEIGDLITCSYAKESWYYNSSSGVSVSNTTYMNLTFPISEIWTQDRTAQDRRYYYYGYGYEDDDNRSVYLADRYETPVILNLASYTTVVNETVLGFTSSNIPMVSYQIWIDRSAVIDLADIHGTVSDLEFIQHRLQAIGSVWIFNVQTSELEYRLTSIAPDLQAQKLLFLALSLPVMALGVYLSIVGVDLGINSRRREVGMLKSRGASNRQVFTGLMLEALMLGAFAALTGLVLGVGVSRFLVGVAGELSSGAGSETFVTDFRISSTTIELAIIFGVLLMLLSSYRPFKRVANMDIAEALHQYSQTTTSTMYKARTDIILLILSGISITSILIGYDWIDNQSWSWITRLLLAVLMAVGIAVFPLMPFMLSLSVIRLMTRGSRKLYSKFTLIVKPWTKELHELVDRNIVRNPKRASNLCVIIALALAFGLFISVTMESSLAYQRETVKFDVGADIRLDGSIRGEGPPSAAFEGIAGVADVSRFDSLAIRQVSGPYSYGFYLTTAMLEADKYADMIDPSSFYFVDSDRGILEELSQQSNTVLLTDDFAKNNYILVGDMLGVGIDEPLETNGSYSTKTWAGQLTVIGLVKGLPGFQNFQAFVGMDSITWIPKHNLTASVQSAGAFIGVDEGANVTSIVGSSLTIATAWNWSANARTIQDELAALEDDIAFGTLSDFLYTEYAMAIAIMSVGVGLIIFVAVTDRQHELACIMARGASGPQMRRILMGESMSLMALGLIVGSAVGTLSAYMFNTLTQPGYEGVVPHQMVFTYVTWIMVAVSVASLLVASLLATSRAGKIRLAEVLRVRGG